MSICIIQVLEPRFVVSLISLVDMPRSGFAIHVSNVTLIFINLISPGNFEEFREALFRRNFTIRGGDISFNEKSNKNKNIIEVIHPEIYKL